MERVCENEGCDESLAGRDAAARFCSDRCRAQHWKREHNYGRHDPPRGRARHAKKRPPEPRISFNKALQAIGDELDGEPAELGARVRAALESCLSEKARQAVASGASS